MMFDDNNEYDTDATRATARTPILVQGASRIGNFLKPDHFEANVYLFLSYTFEKYKK